MKTNWSGLFQKKNWDFLLPAIFTVFFYRRVSTCCFLEKARRVDTSFIQQKHPCGTTRLPTNTWSLNIQVLSSTFTEKKLPNTATWRRWKIMKIETEPKQKTNTKHFFVLKLKYHMDFQFKLPILCRHRRIWKSHQKETHGNRTSAAVICRSRNKTQLFETTYSCRSQESHNHFCLHDLSPLK